MFILITETFHGRFVNVNNATLHFKEQQQHKTNALYSLSSKTNLNCARNT